MVSSNQRKTRTTNKIVANSDRPRLVIFRSNKEIYATVIDAKGKVLAAANSLKTTGITKAKAAEKVGTEIATKAKANKVTEIVFDRRGYKYHGRVAALAKAARDAGLKF
jgi:large subunit ribosomal protein L18